MKPLPKNGSLAANSLLLLAGAVVGSVSTWIAVPRGEREAESFSAAAADEFERNRPDGTRPNALGGGGGGLRSGGSVADEIAAAQAESDPSQRAHGMREAGERAVEEGVVEALRKGEEIDSDRDRLDYHRGLFGAWAESDAEAALGHAKTHFSPGLLQSEAISIGINKWGAANPREAWVWAEQNLSGPLKEQALTDLMIGWTRRSPEAASSWLSETGYTSQPLFGAVAATLAEAAPESALAWAGALTDPVLSETAKVAVASEWVRQAPEEASAAFTADVETDGGVNLATAITQIWGTTDPAATARWVADLAPGAGKNEAAATLATVWAATDIEGAVAWSSTLADAGMRRQVVAHIGTTWGAIEPGAALEWLSGLPREEAAEGVLGAYNSWAATDPIGMRAYIDGAPQQAEVDAARRSLGEVLTGTDMAAAMEVASGMVSEADRADTLAGFYRHWRKVDEPAADEWLAAGWSRFSPLERERLERQARARVIPR